MKKSKGLSEREKRIADRAFEMGMWFQEFDGNLSDSFLKDKYLECAKAAKKGGKG